MPRRRLSSRALAWIALAAIALAACDSIYYKTMKKFGWEKRDILVKKVVEARGAQADAQKEIKTTLERFKEIVDVDGGRSKTNTTSSMTRCSGARNGPGRSTTGSRRSVTSHPICSRSGRTSSASIRIAACGRRASASSARRKRGPRP